jgi:hypothetical protein
LFHGERAATVDRLSPCIEGYYWDTPAMQKEIIAVLPDVAAGPARTPARPTLNQRDRSRIPTGINATSWPILLRLAGVPEERLYRSERRFAHTIAADNFLFLQEIRQQALVPSGARLLLFTYGFGSTWCGLILHH